MIRYKPEYNLKADRFVQETGNWEFAFYLGHYHERSDDGRLVHDWLAFRPMHNDSRPYVEGLPIYVLVDETDIRFTDVSECFKVLDQIAILDIYAKGRKIFREFEKKFYSNDFANDKEREYIREIMQVMLGHYEVMIDDGEMYLFLQESKRLGRPIEIVPDDEENRGKIDGWSYYLKLK